MVVPLSDTVTHPDKLWQIEKEYTSGDSNKYLIEGLPLTDSIQDWKKSFSVEILHRKYVWKENETKKTSPNASNVTTTSTGKSFEPGYIIPYSSQNPWEAKLNRELQHKAWTQTKIFLLRLNSTSKIIPFLYASRKLKTMNGIIIDEKLITVLRFYEHFPKCIDLHS